MKKTFFFLIITTVFLLGSCGDDNDDMEPDNFITATINGSAFEATTVSGISDNTFGEELVLINGTQASNSMAIGLNIATSLGTGSFAVEADDFAITFSDDILNSTDAFFTEGTLNITRNDTTENILQGTFEFTATAEDDDTNVFNVSQGEFNVSYF